MRTKYEREVRIQKTSKKKKILETSITQWVRNLVTSTSTEQSRNEQQETQTFHCMETAGKCSFKLFTYTQTHQFFFVVIVICKYLASFHLEFKSQF